MKEEAEVKEVQKRKRRKRRRRKVVIEWGCNSHSKCVSLEKVILPV